MKREEMGFWKFKDTKEGKHCEWCGNNSEDFIYRFIAEQINMIFLSNPKIVRNDRERKILTLSNGENLDYSLQTDSEHAVNTREFSLHIFCGEACEDKFLGEFGVALRPGIENNRLMINWQDENVFVPTLLPADYLCPENMWSRCKECKSSFPSTTDYPYFFNYRIIKILKSTQVPGVMGQKPAELAHYNIGLTDMNEAKPTGTFYLYDFNNSDIPKEDDLFCSKECAFEYAKNNNSIILHKNNLLKGTLRVITPDTVRINQSLGNKYLYRSHILNN